MTGRRLERTGAALAAAWLAVFATADVLTRSPDVVLVVLFAVAPLIASAVLSPWLTAVYAAAATLLAAVSLTWDHPVAVAQHSVRVTDVAVISTAAVLLAVVRTRRERRLSQLVAIADVAQRAVLPVIPTMVAGLGVATRYVSAAEEASVGGDFYDLFHGDAVVRVLVGDVRGKGLDGVQHAARVIRAFRQSAAAVPDLAAVAKQMSDYLVPFFADEDFVTALLVEIVDDGMLTFVGCGHHPPLLVGAGRTVPVDGLDGLPFGLATSFAAVTVPWHRGDRLLLYTDGLVEARDDHGDFLAGEAIAGCLQLADRNAALDALLATLYRHVPHGRLTDDLALVLIDNVG